MENYVLQEDALSLLFNDLCPLNISIPEILLKVSALNDFYSTNIYNTFSVAKHIQGLGIDQRLWAEDLSVVNEIARVRIGNKERNFYSFATKYCSHHAPDAFPIYDSYVERVLLHFKRKESFSAFSKSDLKQYDCFVRQIESFRDYFNLNQFTLRDIDIYLWQAGKEYFPKHY